MILAKASLNHDCSFIVVATVIMIVNYDCKTFIVQATGLLAAVISRFLGFQRLKIII